MRISDWSADVCSSDLALRRERRKRRVAGVGQRLAAAAPDVLRVLDPLCIRRAGGLARVEFGAAQRHVVDRRVPGGTERRPVLASRQCGQPDRAERSEEHTSALQSLMRISYAVFCLTKKNTHQI